MDRRPFEFNDGQRLARLRGTEESQHGVGRLAVDGVMLLAVPNVRGVRRSGVTQGVAENLREKVALHLRFVQLGQPARHVEVGPLHDDGVRGLKHCFVQAVV